MKTQYFFISIIIIIIFGVIVDYQGQRLQQLESRLKNIEATSSKIVPMETELQNLSSITWKVDRLEAKNDVVKNLGLRLNQAERLFPSRNEEEISQDLNEPYVYYTFDSIQGNIILDKGTGGHNGFLIGPQFIIVAGVVGNALSFNGFNQSINIDSLQKAVSHDAIGTIMFWAKSDGGDGTLLSFGSYSESLKFIINEDTRTEQIISGFKGRLNPSWNLITKRKSVSNPWWHFALVQDGIKPQIYLNGQPVPLNGIDEKDNFTTWFVDYPNFNNGRIGSRNMAGKGEDSFFKGAIDDFRYYRRALKPFEIKAIYEKINGSKKGNTNGAEPS